MTVEIAFFNAAGLLSPELEADVRAGIADAIHALRRHTAVEGLGIAVMLSEYVSRETGMGGRAFGPDACMLWLDETCPQLRIDTRANAAALTAHELHHVLRMRHGFGRHMAQLCAGDIVALEGLATQAELFLGFPEPINVRGVGQEQINPLLDRLDPIVADPGAEWMWIYELNGLPAHIYRAIYPVGHAVVGRYLAATGQTPLSALAVPWQDIWQIARSAAPSR